MGGKKVWWISDERLDHLNWGVFFVNSDQVWNIQKQKTMDLWDTST
jgi:hypothetical protein